MTSVEPGSRTRLRPAPWAAIALVTAGALGFGLALRSASASPPAQAARESSSQSAKGPTSGARSTETDSTQSTAAHHEPEATEPEATEPDPRLEPATKAAARILTLRQEILDSLTETTYQHRTVIRRDEGVYKWDCSGMGAWFLRKAAPVARKALDKGRPVARDFYRHIARASTHRTRKGWRRLAHIEDVRPGDMFAWIRPPGFPSRNTGHMGFALEPARPVPGQPGAYTLRIFDATSLPHQDDTRQRGDGGGIGAGTILFLTDDGGRGTAYGWFGLESRGVIETDIVFGRLSR